jgi:transposase
MDWARRLVVSGGELVVEVASANGTTHLLGLAELYRRGLPGGEKVVRQTLTVNFADFVPCNAREYAVHFGIPVAGESVGGHQVFEVQHKGQRFLVPALALMRALFRPASKLLANMFAPSALERTCHIDSSQDDARIVIDARWATRAQERQNSDWVGPLSWMMLHPSARRMADSVHRHAMGGCLGVDLPHGQVEVVLAGVHSPSAVMATEVRLLSVVPADAPEQTVVCLSHQVSFINRDWARGRNVRMAISTEVPLHKDGSICLTDAEWAVVGPMLEGQRSKPRPYEHCQRSLFEGVLTKLATGKCWRLSPYAVGDWRNAATSYRRWKTRGTFAAALEALRTMRSRPQVN